VYLWAVGFFGRVGLRRGRVGSLIDLEETTAGDRDASEGISVVLSSDKKTFVRLRALEAADGAAGCWIATTLHFSVGLTSST